MRHRRLFLTLLFVFSMAALFPVKLEAAGAVKLNKKKVVLDMETQYQLKMKNTMDQVKWSTSDEDVVEVEDGLLIPVSVGSTKVTAKVNGKKYVCKVTVADYSDMSIEQKEVVSFALQYVGNKYVYGGTSLTKGADCSGFTMAVYDEFGYELKHNAYEQLKETKTVKMKNIQPGDLVFYGSSKKNCSHVAMYIGNEKVVHASTESTGIVVSDYKYRKYVGVGRVLDTATYPEPEPEEDVYPGEETDDSVTRMAVSQ